MSEKLSDFEILRELSSFHGLEKFKVRKLADNRIFLLKKLRNAPDAYPQPQGIYIQVFLTFIYIYPPRTTHFFTYKFSLYTNLPFFIHRGSIQLLDF